MLLDFIIFVLFIFFFFFFFNDTATTEIYTLSLHDALPICHLVRVTVAVTRHDSTLADVVVVPGHRIGHTVLVHVDVAAVVVDRHTRRSGFRRQVRYVGRHPAAVPNDVVGVRIAHEAPPSVKTPRRGGNRGRTRPFPEPATGAARARRIGVYERERRDTGRVTEAALEHGRCRRHSRHDLLLRRDRSHRPGQSRQVRPERRHRQQVLSKRGEVAVKRGTHQRRRVEICVLGTREICHSVRGLSQDHATILEVVALAVKHRYRGSRDRYFRLPCSTRSGRLNRTVFWESPRASSSDSFTSTKPKPRLRWVSLSRRIFTLVTFMVS